MDEIIVNPHPLFEQYEVDRVGKLQVRDIKNARLFDLASTVTRPEIVDILKRDHGVGKYTVHPFELNGRQMGGAFIIEIEPVTGKEVAGDGGVAVAERALVEERRRLAEDRRAVAEAEAKLDVQRKLLDKEQSTQLKDLLKQQGDMLTAAAARDKEMMTDARTRADAIIQDARGQAEHVQRQAEDRGRRAAEDTRADADNYHKRAVAVLELAERKLTVVEQREKQSNQDIDQRRRLVEMELEQGKQALAERRLQLERENLDFRLRVQQDANDRKLEAVANQFKAQMAVTLPEEMQAAKAQVEIDRERAKLKKDFGNQGPIADFLEMAQPLFEAFMTMRQQQAPPQMTAHPQIASEPPPQQMHPRAMPQQEEPPPFVEVAGAPALDLHSLVGSTPVPTNESEFRPDHAAAGA